MHLFTHYPPTSHTSFKYVILGNLFSNVISLCCILWSPSKNIPACVKAAGRGAELLYGLQCIIFMYVSRNMRPFLSHFPASSQEQWVHSLHFGFCPTASSIDTRLPNQSHSLGSNWNPLLAVPCNRWDAVSTRLLLIGSRFTVNGLLIVSWVSQTSCQ